MIRTSVLPIRSAFTLVMAIAVVALLLLMTHQETQAGAEDAFAIDPTTRDIGVGGSGSVDLVATPGPDSLAIWILEVSFDPDIISFDSCTSLANPPGSVAASVCESKDTGGSADDDTVVSLGGVIFGASELGLEDETTLASMSFDAVGDIGECSDLTIEAVSHLGPDPEDAQGDATLTHGEICIVEDVGEDRIWADADCNGAIETRDNQALLRNVLGVAPLSQEPGCPPVGSDVTVDGTDRIWADADCNGAIETRDNQAVLRNVLGVAALSQEPGCPPVGSQVVVSD